jgi:uncharacterized protein with PIN domain
VAEIKFLFDEHVAGSVAQALRRRGIDVVTAAEASLIGADDSDLLEFARAEARVIVTHDSDFLRLHHQGIPHDGIAYCKQGLRTIGQVVSMLILVYEALDSSEMAGRVEYL